jgi:hypothetical protein
VDHALGVTVASFARASRRELDALSDLCGMPASRVARVARRQRCVAASVSTTGKMSGDGSSSKFSANAIVAPWGRWRPTNVR